jgi:hypothetical protein
MLINRINNYRSFLNFISRFDSGETIILLRHKTLDVISILAWTTLNIVVAF